MTQTLGQYFKELRESTRRFPLLDRSSLEAMPDDDLRAELARRLWGMPSGARQGKRSSREAWITHFLRQQAAQRCPTFKDIAKRTKLELDPVAIWKIEHDKGVRAETVRAALVEGLGFAPDSAEVRRALALWTGTKTAIKVDASLQQSIDDVQQNATFNEFLQRLIPVAAAIPASEYNAVLEALGNPAIVESFPSLNKLAAAGKTPRLRVVSQPKN